MGFECRKQCMNTQMYVHIHCVHTDSRAHTPHTLERFKTHTRPMHTEKHTHCIYTCVHMCTQKQTCTHSM